jgi:arsenate reductase-like glutaredoxin family protein
MELLGLKACDTCRKAAKALEAAGKAVDFRDVRDDPLPQADLAALHEVFGEALVNRRSTTWRGLSEDERAGDPVDLLQAHPTLMKRPVIRDGNVVYLGWTKETKAALGL